ncbi:MAG: ABC transporter ATP-binding protein/permease [Oscillospiraceae bacterium]|jgi:ATP-binding cassette subfamily B protein|nr:ABC transporter ATP-binding protein/permease [Oscillospiraceae bacterium]
MGNNDQKRTRRASARPAYGVLLGLMKGHKRRFAAAILASVAGLLMSFLTPQVVGFTIDVVLGGGAPSSGLAQRLVEALGGVGRLRSSLIICALGVAVCAAASGAFNYISRSQLAIGTERFIKRLRDALFSHTQRLPLEWHMKNLTGDVVQRCTSDVETARRFVSEQLIEVVHTVILAAAALAIMFNMNAVLAGVVALFMPVILGYSLFFGARVSRQFRACDEAEGELMVSVQENLTGVRVVRAFGRERFELGRFDAKNDALAEKWIKLGLTLGVYWSLGDVISAASVLAVTAAGAYLAALGRLSLGDFLIFLYYTQTIAGPVRQLGRTLSEMSKAVVSLGRVSEILSARAEPDEPDALRPPLGGDIVFDRVSFSYDGQPALRELSFTAKGGATLGILGATGSGKSTVAYLLSRLYELPEGCGSITIGGTDVRLIDRRYLRRNVGLVLQEPTLFSKTIFENIDIASGTGDPSAVRERARVAAVDSDITAFKDGYDTPVGERGVTLSGGQKQRVAIARTLMLSPPVIVFDDSMSSLDMRTDAAVRDALRGSTSGATVIIISHRISTLMRADSIIVLDGGRVAEAGTHGELLEKNGIYRRVHDIQSAEGARTVSAPGGPA